jgi:two-component system response regulator ResD
MVSLGPSAGRILLVEDERMVAEVVERYLRRDGYEVVVATDGAAALALAAEARPDLIVLDLMLPEIDGLEVCRQVRKQGQTPIIMLTARTEEIDKLLGLELGADDYVTKPFSPRELVSRVRAVLRRSGPSWEGSGRVVRFADIKIDVRRRVVETTAGFVTLTAREFDLLAHLAAHPGQVFTREQLMDAVWDIDFCGDANTVTVHMRRLRLKLEAEPSRPRHLKTVWGVGYKLEP